MNVSSEFRQTIALAGDLLEMLINPPVDFEDLVEKLDPRSAVRDATLKSILADGTTTHREKVVRLLLRGECVNLEDVLYNALFDPSKFIPDLKDKNVTTTYTVWSEILDEVTVELDLMGKRWINLDGRRFRLVTEEFYRKDSESTTLTNEKWITYENLRIHEPDCTKKEQMAARLEEQEENKLNFEDSDIPHKTIAAYRDEQLKSNSVLIPEHRMNIANHAQVEFVYEVPSSHVGSVVIGYDNGQRWIELDGRPFLLVTEEYFHDHKDEVNNADDIWTTYDAVGVLERDCNKEERRIIKLQKRLQGLGLF